VENELAFDQLFQAVIEEYCRRKESTTGNMIS
jgi:hypothetical protein